MLTTIHLCGRCSNENEHVRKNGSNGGRAKYQCISCRYQGYLQPTDPSRAGRYVQVEKLMAE
jgi:transposase-like protein